MGRKFALFLACLSAAAIGTPGSAQNAPPVPAAGAKPGLVPLADHHVHLYSPADAALATPPFLPEIGLPADLARVLQQRNERRTDQKALAELYTSDALYFRGGTVGWAKGREAAAGYVKWTISDWPYRIVPVAYNRHGASARIAGYYMEGKAFDQRFGTSLLDLTRGKDGVWRIAAEIYVFGQPSFDKPKTAADAIAQLDAAGTRRGVVLSDAYYFDSVRPEPIADPYPQVRAENDWTAEQVAQYPDRLIAFCSFNPLRDYALAELRRCVSSGRFKGLKMNFNAAQLNFKDPEQLARVRAVMAAANGYRLPMVIHVRPGNTYGKDEAGIFLDQLVAAAPDVPVQIAHLWGGESYSADALKVYADAVSSGHPSARNLYFDVSGVPSSLGKPESLQEVAARMRQIGFSRLLYGSDAPPVEAWDLFRKKLPLTDEEFRIIATNVAPYLRGK